MTHLHNFTDRLRAILGLKSWDYCVMWKLSDDQRFLEWMDCCCGGTESIHNGEQLHFPASSALPCRDVMLQHPRTKSCHLLAELPSSIPLDSGVHAEALMSNRARWLNFTPNLDSTVSEETVGTRVLIPVTVGLVEFFVAKQVPEDGQMIEFVTAECNLSLDQQAIIQSDTTDSNFQVNLNGFHDAPSKQLPADESDQRDPHDIFHPATIKDNADLSYVIPVDRIHLSNPPINFSQHFSYTSDNVGSKNSMMFFEGTHDLSPFKPSPESGMCDMDSLQKHMMDHPGNMLMHSRESLPDKEDQGNENDCFKQENVRSNSMSDSDPNDDDDDTKYRRRNGKGEPQSKNLVAERKRRKKLNDRLYALRALVPKISKLDRASILGDAIEFVMELQKQVKDLQNELEEHSDDEDSRNTGTSNNHTSTAQTDIFQQNGMIYGHKSGHEKFSNGYHKGTSRNGGIDLLNQNHESENTIDKVQQMEPQVEVAQLDGNEFFVRVFCEHKPGGFVRLMEALNSLGLEVTNVNAARHTCLVSNIFKVERRDMEMLQADHVRDSLLELTRNPSNIGKASENGSKNDHHGQHHHSHLHIRQMNAHHLHRLHN